MNKLRTFIIHLFRRQAVRDVAVVAMGTFIAQTLNLMFSPLITRLFGPEAFGVLGVFNSLLLILTPVAAMTYPIAIVLPEEDKDARSLAQLSMVIAGAVTLLTALVFFIFKNQIVSLLRVEKIEPYLLLIPFVMFFAAFRQVSEQFLIRKQKFMVNARLLVFRAAILNILKTGTGFFFPYAVVLVLFESFGYMLHSLLLYLGIKKAKVYSVKEEGLSSYQDMIARGKDYRDFLWYRSPQTFLASITENMPVIMLSAFFGPASAGYYVLVRKALTVPIHLMGKAVGDVFYQRIARAANADENLLSLLVKATGGLAAIGVVPFVVISVWGSVIFPFIFGAEWVTAGEYARWISVWLFLGLVRRPCMDIIPVLRMQGFLLIFQIVLFFIMLSLLLVGCYVVKDDGITIILLSAGGTVMSLFLMAAVLVKTIIVQKK